MTPGETPTLLCQAAIGAAAYHSCSPAPAVPRCCEAYCSVADTTVLCELATGHKHEHESTQEIEAEK